MSLVIDSRIDDLEVLGQSLPGMRKVGLGGDFQCANVPRENVAHVFEICLACKTQIFDVCLGGDLVHHLAFHRVDDGLGFVIGDVDAHEGIIHRINHTHGSAPRLDELAYCSVASAVAHPANLAHLA